MKGYKKPSKKTRSFGCGMACGMHIIAPTKKDDSSFFQAIDIHNQ
jgi:hypothetical protein